MEEDLIELERVEQKIGIKTIEFNHDSRCDREPDGSKNRCSGKELFHG